MKVLVLGASGIVGQHMRICVPAGVSPIWVRKTADPITRGWDVDVLGAPSLLDEVQPDVVINLMGESRVDVVANSPEKHHYVNVYWPHVIARWCKKNGRRMIQVSSQAVFDGDHPPYKSNDIRKPVNAYGRQKSEAEDHVFKLGATIVRLSFILGIRPLPHVGRQNPLEAMIAGQSPQVCDRFFSPLMAMDAAKLLWEFAQEKPKRTYHLGCPEQWSRWEVACMVNPDVKRCENADFPGIAPRPVDTTYSDGRFLEYPDVGIPKAREMNDRAIELSLFFGITYDEALAKLATGWEPLHNAVSDEFRSVNPKTEAELLDWYRTTEAYIWELSAYHEDSAGFNYSGMVGGIVNHLKANECQYVLCVGDGIGDLTLALREAGLDAAYHDLEDSRTQQYARFRYWRKTGRALPEVLWAEHWNTKDAVIALDFLEHVSDVEFWVKAIHNSLKTGGLFHAQNRFGCGSDGPIPMHLKCNDHWVRDWDAMVKAVGFEDMHNGWLRKI